MGFWYRNKTAVVRDHAVIMNTFELAYDHIQDQYERGLITEQEKLDKFRIAGLEFEDYGCNEARWAKLRVEMEKVLGKGIDILPVVVVLGYMQFIEQMEDNQEV